MRFNCGNEIVMKRLVCSQSISRGFDSFYRVQIHVIKFKEGSDTPTSGSPTYKIHSLLNYCFPPASMSW